MDMPSNLETSVPQELGGLYDDLPSAPAQEQASQVTSQPALLGTVTGTSTKLCYFLGDIVAVLIGLVVGKLLTSWIAGTWWTPIAPVELKFFGIFAMGMFASAAKSGCYNTVPPRPARQFRTWTIGVFLVSGSILISAWLFDLGFTTIAPTLIVATFITHLAACFLRAYCRIKFGKKDWWGTRVLVVGSNPAARESMRYLLREPQWGLRPAGFLAEDESVEAVDMPLPCLGTIEDLNEVTHRTGVERALVALHPLDLKQMREQFYHPDAPIRHWIVIPSPEYFNVLWSDWNETARMPAVTVSNRLAMPRVRAMKRAFDLVVAGLITLCLLPLLLLISVMIRIGSQGPVLYKHRRIGHRGEPFEAWKFRTMVQNADETLARHFEENPELREEWQKHQKLKDDPRISSVGRFLRATSLDELPQLWNVLKGDMSLVGPRPIVTSEANKYHSHFRHYQQVLPGITGLWQVSGRNDTSYKERIELDVYYVENWSIWLDLYILACTVKVVLLREGAY